MERPGLKKETKILVAMSGGVDSSVAALLLKEAGFQPVGVTMRFWVDPLAEEKASAEARGCCSLKAVEDARQVAQALDIPHYVVNMQEPFYKKVVCYFTREYLRGRTPNPCVVCNRQIKFSLLLQKAKALGIDYLATGHYARVFYDPKAGIFRLLRGKDKEKDQSYMLYVLSQEQLSSIIFPLGELTKEEVRQKASERGLRVAEKKESQEICFLPDNDYRGFLEREHPQALVSGDIISTSGEKLGRHKGLPFYTIGQRKGLGLTSPYPLYVVRMDPQRNLLVVGREEEVYSWGLVAKELNFVSGLEPDEPLKIQVKIRYRAPFAPATLFPPKKGEAKVLFGRRQKAVTPGQAAVFYVGEEVIGGGTIEKAIK